MSANLIRVATCLDGDGKMQIAGAFRLKINGKSLFSGVARFRLTGGGERNQNKTIMPRGDKSGYTVKQKRQAEHIEEGYEYRGVKPNEARRRAWATVNKMTGGGKKHGSGRGKAVNVAPARKGGRIGGRVQSR